MHDQFAEILAYAKGVIRRRWVIVLFAWLTSVVGWTYVYEMPDKFNSEARVHVDTRTMLRPLLRGMAVQTDVRGLVAIMKKLMFTQKNMLKVAELAGIEGDYSSEKGRYKIVNQLKSNLKISGGREEIFSISYESTNPDTSQKVVQAVLSVFSEQTQQSTLNDVGTAQRFIDDQIREYEQRLRNAEKARENFKRVNLGLLPGQGEDQISKLQAIRSDLEQIEMTVAEMKARKKVLQMQLDEAFESDDEWGLTNFDSQDTEEDSRISSLKEQRDELLIKYTPNHPYVKAIDSTIKELEQRALEEEDTGEEEPSLEAMSNPYVQAIKTQINQVDAEIATLKSRAGMYQKTLKKVDEQFSTRLSIETEMKNLNRDYETIRANYIKLIERREQAALSEKVDNQASSLKFKIVDPANRPQKPSAPNRTLLYSVVLLAGLAIGIGIALLLVLIRPVFSTTKNLRAVTGLPVLGSVSVFLTDQQIRRQRLNNIVFYGVSLLLLTGYSGIMAKELLMS